MTLLFDIETRSKADLKAIGGWAYAHHPSTEILCAVWMDPAADITYVYSPLVNLSDYDCDYTMVSEEDLASLAEHTWVAHNAEGFDRPVWENAHRKLLPQPKAWVDSLKLARVAGLPGSLDAVSKQLLGAKKDAAGRKVMLKYSIPDKKTGEFRHLSKGAMALILEYCVQDTRLLAQCWETLNSARKFDSDTRWADARINRRGFAIHQERASQILRIANQVRERAVQRVRKYGLTLRHLRSPAYLKEFLRDRGYDIHDVQADTLRGLEGIGAEVCEARLAVGRTTFGKFEYMLRALVNGRLFQQLAYGSAHTLRWGGRGVQPQNLPRGVLKPVEVTSIINEGITLDTVDRWAATKGCSPGDILASLIRCCIVPGSGFQHLAILDFSAVEVAGVAWIGRDHRQLAQLETGVDPYILFIKRALGLDIDKRTPEGAKLRQAIKAVVLGCGYQLGAQRLQAYAEQLGGRLEDTGRSAQELVDLYRDTYPNLAGERFSFEKDGETISGRSGGLWKKLEQSAVHAVKGFRKKAGRCRFERHGPNLVVWLPNGDPQIYRQPVVRKVPTPWGTVHDQLFYMNPKGGWDDMYGGKWCENLVQRICRDIHSEALVRLEKAGFRIVLHVHDEAILEVTSEDQLEEIKEIMEIRPAWCEDFPIRVEGGIHPFYVKD